MSPRSWNLPRDLLLEEGKDCGLVPAGGTWLLERQLTVITTVQDRLDDGSGGQDHTLTRTVKLCTSPAFYLNLSLLPGP